MEPAHHVEQSVVIPLSRVEGEGSLPEGFHKFGSDVVGGCQTGHRQGGSQSGPVIRIDQLPVGRIDAAIAVELLTEKESLDAVAQLLLARILAPPGIIDRPVGGGAPGVPPEIGGIGVRGLLHRLPVEMGVVGGESRKSIAGLHEKVAACFGR